MRKIGCILLIDDNEDDNEYHEMIIRKAAVCGNIRTALNGIKGLEYIEKAAITDRNTDYPRPNLIFLDINMPKMNGFEFLDAYHKLDNRLKAEVVICMLTTSLNPADRTHAQEIDEVNDFLEKPLTTDMLTKIMEKYFRNGISNT